jgi:hypothetical protein
MKKDYHYFGPNEYNYIEEWATENGIDKYEVVKLSKGYRVEFYLNKAN